MKKIDYFLTALILTLCLTVGVFAMLIAEINSSRYISASLPRLVDVDITSPLKGEVTLFGEIAAWDLTQYEDEIQNLRRYSALLPREPRIAGKTVAIIFEEIKAFFENITTG